MANLQKFTRGGVIGLSNHIERKTDNHSNKEIDVTRTHLNYSLVQTDGDMTSRLKKRLDEVYCFNRADVNVLGSWIVTLPKNLKENSEQDQREFFEQSFNFMAQRYGEKNVVAGEVHVDETTPHIHFSFVPVVPDEKKGEKVSAKLLLNRTDLKSFHTDLDRHLKNNLPFYEGGVLTGDTDKTIKDAKIFKEVMKATDIKKNELQQTEKQKSVVQNEKDVAEVKLEEINLELDQRTATNEKLIKSVAKKTEEDEKLSISISTKLKKKEKLSNDVDDLSERKKAEEDAIKLVEQQKLDLINSVNQEVAKYKQEQMEKAKKEIEEQVLEFKQNIDDELKNKIEQSKRLDKRIKTQETNLGLVKSDVESVQHYLKNDFKPFQEIKYNFDGVRGLEIELEPFRERLEHPKKLLGIGVNKKRVDMDLDDYEILYELASNSKVYLDNFYEVHTRLQTYITANEDMDIENLQQENEIKELKTTNDELRSNLNKLRKTNDENVNTIKLRDGFIRGTGQVKQYNEWNKNLKKHQSQTQQQNRQNSPAAQKNKSSQKDSGLEL